MKIQKLTNNRLYYSENEFFRVCPDIVFEFALKKGMIVEDKEEEKLLKELLLFRAYSILSKRDYTEKEMIMKLKMEFPGKAPFEKVIEVLKEKTYIDDYSYAKNYIENKKISKKKIFYDLSLRGIKREIIEEIYAESSNDEKEQILKLIEKIKGKDEKKSIEYLLRRGYNLRDIFEVIKENKK